MIVGGAGGRPVKLAFLSSTVEFCGEKPAFEPTILCEFASTIDFFGCCAVEVVSPLEPYKSLAGSLLIVLVTGGLGG